MWNVWIVLSFFYKNTFLKNKFCIHKMSGNILQNIIILFTNYDKVLYIISVNCLEAGLGLKVDTSRYDQISSEALNFEEANSGAARCHYDRSHQ
jgi:hypothetical protein